MLLKVTLRSQWITVAKKSMRSQWNSCRKKKKKNKCERWDQRMFITWLDDRQWLWWTKEVSLSFHDDSAKMLPIAASAKVVFTRRFRICRCMMRSVFICMFVSNRKAFRLRQDAHVSEISNERSFYVREICDLRHRTNIIRIFIMI
jgi:hypothetical protein